MALPKSGIDECFGGGLSTLLGCCKFWGIISFAFGGHHVFLLCAIENFHLSCWWLLHLTSWSLNLKFVCLKQPWSIMLFKNWRNLAKNATIWSACGWLYRALRCSLCAYLRMWSLPNLICVRFQDLLKMNIASTLHLSCKAHFIIVSPPILTCVWECLHKTFITLSLFLIPRSYLHGRKRRLVIKLMFEVYTSCIFVKVLFRSGRLTIWHWRHFFFTNQT
jgi:hypothetical protein